MAFIGRLGTADIDVPANQSIIVGCVPGGAKVYYGTLSSAGTYRYTLQAVVTGASTFGSFSAGQRVRVEAPNGAEVEYVTGTTPQLTSANPGDMPTMQMGTGQQVLKSVANALVAHAGGGQAGGTPITADINRFATVATGADSALLPASAPGMEKKVTNAGANSMNVFPAAGEVINALAANAAFAVAAGKTAVFSCAVAGQWDTLLTA